MLIIRPPSTGDLPSAGRLLFHVMNVSATRPPFFFARGRVNHGQFTIVDLIHADHDQLIFEASSVFRRAADLVSGWSLVAARCSIVQ